MKITRELREHIRGELGKVVAKEGEKQIKKVEKKHRKDYVEIKKIKKEQEKADRQFNHRINEVKDRLRAEDSELIEFYEWGSDNYRVKQGSELDGVLNKILLKLQYEATDLSEIDKIIKEVIGS